MFEPLHYTTRHIWSSCYSKRIKVCWTAVSYLISNRTVKEWDRDVILSWNSENTIDRTCDLQGCFKQKRDYKGNWCLQSERDRWGFWDIMWKKGLENLVLTWKYGLIENNLLKFVWMDQRRTKWMVKRQKLW